MKDPVLKIVIGILLIAASFTLRAMGGGMMTFVISFCGGMLIGSAVTDIFIS